MVEIVLIDTSVYLNILDVPGWNQDRDKIFEDFTARLICGDIFLLPMATIWETGNHMADVKNGAHRRQYAEKLVQQVNDALEGSAPFRATHFPDKSQFGEWLSYFPQYASMNKSEKKTREGVSLSDMSIIKEWEMICARHSMSDVLIWSLDADLSAYHRVAGA